MGGGLVILFHGSTIPNIKVLEPYQADHDRPYVYMTTIEIVAGFYLINAVERPYYWFPYGFEKNGTVHYQEWYPNALQEVSQGKKGYIYRVEVSEDDVLPFKNIPCAKLGTHTMEVLDSIEISDCYQWLMEEENKGSFILRKYEDKTPEQIDSMRKYLLEYLDEKNMKANPCCSYARFIQLKFPEVWDRYINLTKWT